MHDSDEKPPLAAESEEATSDASGAEVLATDAAYGAGAAAASAVRHSLTHWLLSLVPGRR